MGREHREKASVFSVCFHNKRSTGMGKGYYKKFLLVGPGGTKCKCCFPQSGTKAAAKCRHRLFRIGTKRFNRFISQMDDE
jgi:hypothetical protein